MQVPLLSFDEYDQKGRSAHENARDQDCPVLQKLQAKIHTEEPTPGGLGTRARWIS